MIFEKSLNGVFSRAMPRYESGDSVSPFPLYSIFMVEDRQVFGMLLVWRKVDELSFEYVRCKYHPGLPPSLVLILVSLSQPPLL